MTSTAIVPLAVSNLVLGLIAIPFYVRLAKAKNIVDTPNQSKRYKIHPLAV